MQIFPKTDWFGKITCSHKLFTQPTNILSQIDPSYPWHFATLQDHHGRDLDDDDQDDQDEYDDYDDQVDYDDDDDHADQYDNDDDDDDDQVDRPSPGCPGWREEFRRLAVRVPAIQVR